LKDREIAYRRFPTLVFDEREPFLPSRVAYSIFREPCDSNVDPRRRLGTKNRIVFALPGLDSVVEYGIWWDWDIQHLYELEAAWAYLGEEGEYLKLEASWHGRYNVMYEDPADFKGGRPVLYSQPGKHAFASDPAGFPREVTRNACSRDAGRMGLHVTPLFEGKIAKSPRRDRLASRYLQGKSFVPNFKFSRNWLPSPGQIVTWEDMKAWIPSRIEEVISLLEGRDVDACDDHRPRD